MSSFTKTHAIDTAKKLKTKPKNERYPRLEVVENRAGAHVMQEIWCNGQLVNKFGIKHDPNRNNPHGWVARDLGLSPHKMREFAICHMTIDEMIEHFIDQGFIDVPETEEDTEVDE